MRRRKILLAACVFMLSAFLLSCNGKKVTVSNAEIIFTKGLNEEQLFRIDGKICRMAQAKLLLAVTKNQYEHSFGEEIWVQKINEKTMEDYVKDMVKDQLAQLICMALYAKEEGISLSEAQKEELKEATDLYYESLSEEEIALLGIEKSDLVTMYEDYALAEEIYREKTKDVEEEISDAEAKVIVVQHIFKNTSSIDETQKSEARAVMEQMLQKLKEGADFATMANETSDDGKLVYAFGRGEMEESFEQAAFALETGQLSEVIETSSGYHIIRCISDYDVEKTEANKKKILEKRKKEAFEAGYANFTNDLVSEINEKAWEKIHFTDLMEIKIDHLYKPSIEAQTE